ncbi:MAG: hypothetical protein K8H74_15560 [Notoacmeibacter sp.]|nr:hypothetical protein [Notoacmeibacter sp.]
MRTIDIIDVMPIKSGASISAEMMEQVRARMHKAIALMSHEMIQSLFSVAVQKDSTIWPPKTQPRRPFLRSDDVT